MQVRLDSTTAIASGYTTVELHLSDPQGLPIEQAQVTPNAHMKNMDMMAYAILVQRQGKGNYRILVQLYMAGPWEIDIAAHADGFDTPQRTILVQVQ